MKFIDAKFFELGTIQSLFIAQFSIWCVHFNFYYVLEISLSDSRFKQGRTGFQRMLGLKGQQQQKKGLLDKEEKGLLTFFLLRQLDKSFSDMEGAKCRSQSLYFFCSKRRTVKGKIGRG